MSTSSSLPTPLPIVAGIDGSEISAHAAIWAAEEAERRGAVLTLVHALNLPDSAVPPLQPTGYAERRRAEGTMLLDKATTALRARFPGLTLDVELTDLDPAHTLVELSRDAALVVTGSRGHGGFAGMLLGSVSRKVAAHAHCPVAVVREEPPAPESADVVVLGVGSEPVPAAARCAFETAQREGLGLVALRAWWPNAMQTGIAGVGAVYLGNPDLDRRTAIEEVEAAIKPFRDEFPDVAVRVTANEGNAVPALIDAARTARLLVVGAHRRRGPLSVGPGYVVEGVLAHSPTPVVVVPEQ
jgi:nucleotide-binding universal stress UspA family protein